MKTDQTYGNDYPRHAMTGTTMTHKYIPKKGSGKAQRANQNNSSIAYTINQDLAKSTDAHNDYAKTIRGSKDIRH